MDVVVIDAGITGLASTVRLASQGHHVTIFEKNGKVGERTNQLKKDSFAFNLGPTIIMVPDIYKAIFEECGKHSENYIDIHQPSHVFDIYSSDKDKISVSIDLPQLSQTLEATEPGSMHGFMSFLADVHKRYDTVCKYFLERALHKPSKFYNPIALYRGMKSGTLGKADHLIDSRAKNEKIRKLLAFQTLYIKIDPKRGLSIYSTIPMIEMMHGMYYVKGGMYSFDKDLHRLTQDLGISTELNLDIQEIIIDPKSKHAGGLRVNGDIRHFDKVLCTADFPYVAQHLIPGHSPLEKYASAKVDKMNYSCSVFLIYARINRDLKDKVHLYDVISAEDFRGNISDIFEGRLPKDPFTYLYPPSVENKGLTPEGETSMYVPIPIPELKTGQIDWNNPAITEQVKSEIYKKTETIESPRGLRSDVASEIIFTPLDFETHYNAEFGTVFGLMSALAQSNYHRPPNMSRDCKDLYFVDASIYPGVGILIILTSAKITTKAMLEDIKNMKQNK